MEDQPDRLRIVIGSDDAGRAYKGVLANDLRADTRVVVVRDIGVDDQSRASYPQIALAAAEHVAGGRADRALLVCHTGLGMAIAANKVPGVRAVTAHDVVSVRAAVLSNDAQILALGQGVIGLALARRLVDEWLNIRFAPGTTATAKLAAIRDYEQHRMSGTAAGRGC
ncbi:RpiB/LacA/LacB family sugar-phosphate isomerase [Streptomyces sp. NPDC047974]|uniref:RpiB/LacA/LacB family sugar-phosphate isomerase n=1 Tax=Streptomyces sp. NPDC047974 TaxID=3154343 RepID=UPI00340ADB7D